jgi:hypothetical protein
MFTFDPNSYGPTLVALVAREPLNELGPGTSDRTLLPQLKKLSVDAAFGERKVADREMADCCLSAIWLLHDFLDESHTISQQIETRSGSYWHAIMHRREPDFGNSKYWFRRVGEHATFPALAAAARELAEQEKLDRSSAFLAEQGDWDPMRFVDLCEASLCGRSSSEMLCRRIQRVEWQLLFDDCFRQAVNLSHPAHV